MISSETYIRQLIGLQTRLYAYIFALLADRNATDDVLQETNLVLFRKADEFIDGAEFEPWAFSIARTQCLAFWKLRGRDRLVLGDEAIERIASRAEAKIEQIDLRRDALRECLAALPPKHRQMVETRYAIGGSVGLIADQLGRPEPSISRALYRVRNLLLNCIRRKMSEEGVHLT
jgi:RNA polymerase sigma-70 factor (ECF subfamily)